MKLPDDDYSNGYENNENSTSGLPMAAMMTAVILFIIFIFGITVYMNRNAIFHTQSEAQTRESEAQILVATVENGTAAEAKKDSDSSGKTADDLDIWNMYPEETTTEETETGTDTVVSKPTQPDPSEDGKHTKITNTDGSEEWVVINNYLTKNEYDFTKLVFQGNIMKYYTDGAVTSYMGVDISKYQTYVDFNKLKKAGVEFVMIRLGARGYQSGTLTLDDYFTDNLKRASDADLNIGIYFYSQAVTADEAVEEANMVISNITGAKVTYPIAFAMEHIDNDTSRIDTLTKEQKTDIAKAFLTTIKNAGYKPLLYGSKEWLIKEIDLARLSEYDVWLSQQEDIPDYPYKFSMWQYSRTASIDGIAGAANLDISFIDYTAK